MDAEHATLDVHFKYTGFAKFLLRRSRLTYLAQPEVQKGFKTVETDLKIEFLVLKKLGCPFLRKCTGQAGDPVCK